MQADLITSGCVLYDVTTCIEKICSWSCTRFCNLSTSAESPTTGKAYFVIKVWWVIAQLLVTRFSSFYVVDDFSILFTVLLKEMKILSESKLLTFLFLVLIKGMWRRGDSKISFCNPRGWKLISHFSTTGVV